MNKMLSHINGQFIRKFKINSAIDLFQEIKYQTKTQRKASILKM